MMMRRSRQQTAAPPPSLSMFLYLLFLATIQLLQIDAYPIIAEVDVRETKCFDFNIHDNDDAHMYFLALPSTVDSTVEEWSVSKMQEMVQNEGPYRNLLADVPKEIKDKMGDDKAKRQTTNTWLKMKKPGRPILRNQMLRLYYPVFMRNIIRMGAVHSAVKRHNQGEFSVCFENKGNNGKLGMIQIVFDIKYISEEDDEGDDDDGFVVDDVEDERISENKGIKQKMSKRQHLNPLFKSFNQVIYTGRKILSEMQRLERDQKRINKTSETTNKRIRNFGYMGIGLLLMVTFLQVTYLRSYFKKKKLM